MSLLYQSPAGVVEVSDAALETFNRHRQLAPHSREAGGQLFYRVERKRIHIVSATEPTGDDLRARFFFWPNRRNEQRDINRFFGSGLHYIGDWHTHPQDIPSPSDEDMRKIQTIFRESKHDLTGMLLIVVGRSPGHDGIWCGLVGPEGISRCQPRPPE